MHKHCEIFFLCVREGNQGLKYGRYESTADVIPGYDVSNGTPDNALFVIKNINIEFESNGKYNSMRAVI